MSRPTKYTEEIGAKIIDLLRLGKKTVEIAEIVGIDKRTFYNWINANTKFFHSVKEARQAAVELVEASLFHRATGYSHPEEKVFNNGGEIVTYVTTKHYPPDPTAAIFWLKNRSPEDWRDRQEIDQSTTLRIDPTNRDELLELAMKARQERIAAKPTPDDDTE